MKNFEGAQIRDEVWFMEDNKPTCYYIHEIRYIEQLVHLSEYGHPYGHKIEEYTQYKVGKMKDDVTGKSYWVHTLLETRDLFNTKQELIDSL